MPFAPLVGVLVVLLVLLLLWWAFTKIAQSLGAPAPILAIVTVLFVVIAVLYLLSALGLAPAPIFRSH